MPLQRLSKIKSDFIVIKLLEVAIRLVGFCLNLLDELPSLKQIVVCFAIPRSNHIKGEPEHFRAVVENFNIIYFIFVVSRHRYFITFKKDF